MLYESIRLFFVLIMLTFVLTNEIVFERYLAQGTDVNPGDAYAIFIGVQTAMESVFIADLAFNFYVRGATTIFSRKRVYVLELLLSSACAVCILIYYTADDLEW